MKLWVINGLVVILAVFCSVPCRAQDGSGSCHEGFFNIEGSKKCLKLYAKPLSSWYRAKSKCKAEGLILAELENTDPVAVAKHIEDNLGTNYLPWLGAKGDGSNFVWMTGQELSEPAALFYPGYYDKTYKKGVRRNICLALLDYTKLTKENKGRPYISGSCREKRYTLCEEPPFECPEGFFRLENSRQCLKMYSGAYTWEEAKDLCDSKGLKMAHPKNPVALRSHMVKNLGIDAWTWLGARGDGSSQIWQNGDVLSTASSYWFPSFTPQTIALSHRCLAMESTKKWRGTSSSTPFFSFNCAARLAALCQKAQDD